MKIGSFFMVLLAALVALGYFVSDSRHLREDVTVQQAEIERLTQAVQQAEQEKQNALTALQISNQDLQSCQQKVDQSNQTIAGLSEENSFLREQNRALVTQQAWDASTTIPVTQPQVIQATAIGLVILVVLGIGSFMVMGAKGSPTRRKRHAKSGSYVFLTEAEIKEVIKRRRETANPNAPV